MAESNEARNIRRSLSAQLTKPINTVITNKEEPTYPKIRGAIIKALEFIDRP